MEGNNSSLSFDMLNTWSSCSLSELFSSYKLSMALFCISSVLELGHVLNAPGLVSPWCMKYVPLKAAFSVSSLPPE